ncbi:MAG: tRNA (adenosine(37)-N6)-threonylcarbamoyltransferase complex ATPase subunit type 1 TsaE [Candidatus Eremiobacteraeota bacterium]|nr:tRNA (adenosine(37)-N6)-threonylcarbamoyltransferase complex ATPase subunit type 1 TsaE [Candidatus Eremiobacteraeota bacterium]
MAEFVDKICQDAESTRRLGERLAGGLYPGAVIALKGPLGAGKTTFTQGLVRGLGGHEPVTSPTFVLMHIYEQGRLPVFHFDAYRLEGPQQLEEIGADEYFWGDGVSVVEWAERAGQLLPPDHLEIDFELLPQGRRARLQPHGERSRSLLESCR